jgi:hypothetical protein
MHGGDERGYQMMDGTLVRELSAIQADMVSMEGMIEALIRGAYNGTKTEHIGNSLEILKEYIGLRAEKLDMLMQEPAEGGEDSGRA